MIRSCAQHMVLEPKCAKGSQKHVKWLLKRYLRKSQARICVELFDLLHDLDSIFNWHLEVNQHQSQRLSDTFAVEFQRLSNYSFGHINSFLPVNTKFALLNQAGFGHLVAQDFQIYQHIVCNQNLLNMTVGKVFSPTQITLFYRNKRLFISLHFVQSHFLFK